MPALQHATRWRSYNPRGHLSVMTHGDEAECMTYCARTGDTPLAPLNNATLTTKD